MRPAHLIRVTLAAAAAFCTFAATAQVATPIPTAGSTPQSAEQWRNVAAGQVSGASTQLGQAVFLREPGYAGPAINVYVNGEYLTSLLPGAWQQTPLCAGINRLAAHVTDGRSRYDEKLAPGQALATPAGVVTHFKVVPGANGQPQIALIDPNSAQALLANLPRQHHTLPRVERMSGCAQPAPAPAPVVAKPLQTFTLQAGALFAFDRAGPGDLLPQGRQEIANVVAQIQRGVKVERIDVIGHTDPEGSDAYNQQLSQQRAQTVQQALAQGGLPAERISARGVGKSQPLKADCRAQHPKAGPELNACNQINRRVEIQLYGVAAP